MRENVWRKGNSLALLVGMWCGDHFKNLGIKSPFDPAIPPLGIYPEETKMKKTVYSNVHCNVIYNS